MKNPSSNLIQWGALSALLAGAGTASTASWTERRTHRCCTSGAAIDQVVEAVRADQSLTRWKGAPG